MYKKKVMCYIINILIIVLMTLLIPINVYANTYANTSGDTGIKSIRVADSGGLGDLNQFNGTGADSKKLKDMAGIILGVIQTIGTVSSVIVLMVIGVKYMLGSVEEKAEYKKNFVPYLLGAVLLFTGTLIPQLIYEIIRDFY